MVGGGLQSVATLTRDQCSVSKLATSCEQPIRLEHHRTYLDTKSLIRVMRYFFKSSRGSSGSAILWTGFQLLPPDSFIEVPSPSTMLGGPVALREPQRTATNDTLRGDWRGTSLASP